MNGKEFRTIVDQLAKEWDENGGYDTYHSILQFLDESFDRNFYLSLDPNHIIHEEMRNQLCGNVSDSRKLVMSGIMECYDFCNQTNGMDENQIMDFENFND